MSSKKLAVEIEALSAVLSAIADLEQNDQRWVLETAAGKIGLSISAPQAGKGGGAPNPKAIVTSGAGMSPKEFMRAKDPKSDVQRVACIAYYFTNYRETPTFKSRDCSAFNTEAAGPRINMARAVNNAMNQNGYLAAAGGGNKQITALGEDVVNALPDQEAVQAAEHNNRPKRKGKKKRKRAGALANAQK